MMIMNYVTFVEGHHWLVYIVLACVYYSVFVCGLVCLCGMYSHSSDSQYYTRPPVVNECCTG